MFSRFFYCTLLFFGFATLAVPVSAQAASAQVVSSARPSSEFGKGKKTDPPRPKPKPGPREGGDDD